MKKIKFEIQISRKIKSKEIDMIEKELEKRDLGMNKKKWLPMR